MAIVGACSWLSRVRSRYIDRQRRSKDYIYKQSTESDFRAIVRIDGLVLVYVHCVHVPRRDVCGLHVKFSAFE